MIKANDLENSLNSIEESISTLQVQLKSLSDKDNFDVNLNIPTLKQYLNNNLIKIKEKSIDSKELIISLQRSDLLPKLTLNSNYEFTDNEYKVALNLYIPIDFDMNKKIETKRLDYLIERVKLKELLDSEELNYKNFQFKLESIEQKIKNTNAIIKRYDSLIERVDELFRGGMKTSDDLKIIKNTQKSKELDLKIFNLDRDILILNLLKNGV
jgi:outer membrane protein TolC